MLTLILLCFAFVCAVLATFNVPSARFNLVGAALAFWLAAEIFGHAGALH